MKFNWGTGITIFIILFLAACAWFFIYSQRMKVSFVEEDYYPKELRHEEKLVKMRNTNALSGAVDVKLGKDLLTITFPSDFKGKPMTGHLLIYRPSDEMLDISVPVAPDTALCQAFPVSRLSKGKYILKMEWQAEGKPYYKEVDIYIP